MPSSKATLNPMDFSCIQKNIYQAVETQSVNMGCSLRADLWDGGTVAVGSVLHEVRAAELESKPSWLWLWFLQEHRLPKGTLGSSHGAKPSDVEGQVADFDLTVNMEELLHSVLNLPVVSTITAISQKSHWCLSRTVTRFLLPYPMHLVKLILPTWKGNVLLHFCR